MALRTNLMQPLGWTIHRDLPDEVRYVPVLRMPEVVKYGLITHTKALKGENRTPPVTSLYNMLTTFAPEILAFAPIGELLYGGEIDPHWMYVYPDTQSTFKPERLTTLIRSWLKATLGDVAGERQADQWFAAPNWQWDTIDLNCASFEMRKRLLPALIARTLTKQHFQLPMMQREDHTSFDVLLAPLMEMQQYAQLITHPQERKGDRYAFVLKLWLGLLPENQEILMQRVVLRRYMTRPMIDGKRIDLPFRRGNSIYWRRSSGYLSTAPHTDVYTRLTLKRNYGGIDNVQWVGKQSQVLNALHLGEALPEIEALLCDPHAYQPDLLIVKSTQHRGEHEVEPGVWSNDHRGVFRAVTPLITAFATPLITLQRVEPTVKRYRTSSQRPIEQATADVRYKALQLLPHPLRIELYADNPDLIKAAILHEVGILNPSTDELRREPLRVLHEGRLLLEIEQSKVALSDPLVAKSWRERESAIKAKRRTIKNSLKVASSPTGAIIRLDRYRKDKTHDPYEAIRYGLCDTGRVSQFISTGGEKSYALRLRNGVRDLLRTMGFRLNPVYRKMKNSALPDQLDIFGLWIIQLNARRTGEKTVMLPLVIHALSSGATHIYLPGKSGVPVKYDSLYDGIMAASTSEREYENDQPQGVVRFFRESLKIAYNGRDALLLFWGQNVRRVFITDDVLTALFPDGAGRMRVARLFHSQDDDAPMCVPPTPFSKYSGVYQFTDDPFLMVSLHDVGARKVIRDAYKFIALQNPAVNPATLMIRMINLQAEDDPSEWGWVVHQLRSESSHTNIATRLPQPLHDATAIHKYLWRHAADDQDKEADEA